MVRPITGLAGREGSSLRVLFVTREFPPFVVGGSGVHAGLLVKHLRKLGVSCDVLSFGDPEASRDGVTFLRPSSSIKSKSGNSLQNDLRIISDVQRMTRAANERIARDSYDIVHVEEPYVGAMVSHRRKVTTIHDTSYGELRALLRRPTSMQDVKRMIFYITFGAFFELRSSSSSKVIIVPAEHIRKELVGIYGVPERKIRTIRNGVEMPSSFDKSRAKEALGIDRRCVLVFTVSQHIARKRLETLVEAVGKMNLASSRVKVVIAGDGPQRRALIGLAHSLRLEDRIDFPGWISDDRLSLCFEAADIFVLTSEYEAGPLTLLEAMSYGDAVISSRIDGFPRLLREETQGILFKVGDSDELASKLKDLVQDPPRFGRLSAAGVEFVRQFDWDEVARETREVYKELCEKGS